MAAVSLVLRQRHPLADRRGTLMSLLFLNTAPFCGPFLGPFGSSSCARFELFSIVNAVQILVFHTYSASMFCVATSGLLNETSFRLFCFPPQHGPT